VHNFIKKMPSDALLLEPLEPFGRAVKLFGGMLSFDAVTHFDARTFRQKCVWMGEKSLPLVAVSSIFVALALTLQTVNEMRDYRAQDVSGALIALGLLRELGPLTVSLSWAARVAALLSVEANEFGQEMSDAPFIQQFLLPNYLAGLLMSVPLSAYGLVIGFGAAALFAPMLGVSSSNDFLETARLSIRNKDLVVYFVKLIFVNPTVAIFTACAIGRIHRGDKAHISSNAVTSMFIAAVIANFILTYLIYMH
jgi:phospholipid/cholesterol/gamma-HCH transport system permease protein